jgi:hypothetical protein
MTDKPFVLDFNLPGIEMRAENPFELEVEARPGSKRQNAASCK